VVAAFFVVVVLGVELGVELVLGACDVVPEDDELDEEELEDEDEELDLGGGLFAKPVVDVVSAAFLAFFVVFFFVVFKFETNPVLPWLLPVKLSVCDLPTVVTSELWFRRFAEEAGAGESDRRSGASAR
jgi:hypothetical protein